ncbi:MAG: tRNA 2-thiouridine(34) synthase MnmA [Treponema sp. CETP13]|nr:MAG: tRNA 2-thiouridine(34) synthase MnmA [Treponema sp. CETP13]
MNIEKIPVNQPQNGDTCLVGLSGGVDSSLTAILLKERGCKVICVTMSVWKNDLPLESSKTGIRTSCYGPDEHIDIEQCEIFCKEQGFEYHVIDCGSTYKEHVLEYYKSTYRKGLTPNPCIMCNPYVKFGALLEGADKMGLSYDYFCTGHYAALVRPKKPLNEVYESMESVQNDTRKAFSSNISDSVYLHPVMIDGAFDKTKDQGYFLYRVPSKIFEKVRFPLSAMKKTEVVAMAKAHNLVSADRTESQDFIPSEYLDVLFSDKPSVPGDIVEFGTGKKLGEHRGIEHYTIGQRKGLGIAMNHPVYVQALDAEKNQVVLGENDDLLQDSITIADCVWAGNYVPQKPFKAYVKIRFASKPAMAVITPICLGEDASYTIQFEKPVRAVAPGQSAVIYMDSMILGGGIIQ